MKVRKYESLVICSAIYHRKDSRFVEMNIDYRFGIVCLKLIKKTEDLGMKRKSTTKLTSV